MHLVTVTREDISNGYKCVQSNHSVARFMYHFPEQAKSWIEQSEYMALLGCKDEQELYKLAQQADKLGIKYYLFCESDIGNQATSITLEPGEKTRKLTKKYPTLLQEKEINKENSESFALNLTSA